MSKQTSDKFSPEVRSRATVFGGVYQLDASLNYSTRFFLPSTFSPKSARLRSRNFVNQSVPPAVDAGGGLLRALSNLV
jgi:hypothetical protein